MCVTIAVYKHVIKSFKKPIKILENKNIVMVNGHVGQHQVGYTGVHGGYGHGTRNEEGLNTYQNVG